MENKDQSEQTEVKNVSFKDDEKAARKARQTERRLARRAKRNARIARGRHLKNLFIWFLGVLCLPTVIAVASFVVPISVVTGKDGKIVSEELSNKSLFEAVKFVAGNSGELGFADFPIVANAFSDLQKTQIGERDDGTGGTKPITVGDLIYIDTDKLNTIKFGSSDFSGDVSSCIEVVATIDSLGGASALGDFGGLSVFTDEELAGTVAEIDARGETAEEKKQYYYKSSDGAVVYEAAETVYERAFNDDGALVEKLAALSDTDKSVVKLYYPPLEKVKLGELKDIIGDSIGRTTISSLLETLGGDNDKLIDIIGADTTIKGIKDFDINTVAFTNVLEDNAENAQLWNILKDVTGKTTTTDITIGDLSGINTDDIYLNTVLPAPDSGHPDRNKQLYDILLDITPSTITAYDQIKVNDLSGLNTDNLHLTTVLADNTANAKLYNILKDLSGKSDASEITVDDLSGLNTDNLHLSVVLEDNAANAKLYDILKDLTGETTNGAITVGSLAGLDTDNLHLTTVIPSSDNKLLKPLLERNPTIGTLGDTINDIDVSEIFVVECFTEDSSKATDTNAKYTKSTVGGVDHYDLSASGTYYISNEAKVWLFMFYERATGAIVSADVDTKGSITKYEKKSVTFGNMEDGMSDTSDAFMNATVKQLIQSGILTESPSGKYALLYGNSFTDVLEASLIP
ncbi:MAG: hypothetical protein VZQ61_06355 [Christensenellaceae bacterium]